MAGDDVADALRFEGGYGGDLSWAKVGEELSVHEKFAQRLDERLRERLGRALRQQGICEAPPAEGE
ncbi:hypothetical protein [Sorangium cellulosum]|uniref:hypothetical protein n=1 Tax=Sorangium cellulosum TaxID=56 RepID=UPI0002F4B918|nr:hypothetical protein [Sorangium cellulosum]